LGTKYLILILTVLTLVGCKKENQTEIKHQDVAQVKVPKEDYEFGFKLNDFIVKG